MNSTEIVGSVLVRALFLRIMPTFLASLSLYFVYVVQIPAVSRRPWRILSLAGRYRVVEER
ncbi:hypothetical protein D9M71_696890 [compost metagenome]